eukprot:201604-Pleurochrysis_carterae.AAC.1
MHALLQTCAQGQRGIGSIYCRVQRPCLCIGIRLFMRMSPSLALSRKHYKKHASGAVSLCMQDAAPGKSRKLSGSTRSVTPAGSARSAALRQGSREAIPDAG